MQPADIARRQIIFLASDAAARVTGATYDVTAGNSHNTRRSRETEGRASIKAVSSKKLAISRIDKSRTRKFHDARILFIWLRRFTKKMGPVTGDWKERLRSLPAPELGLAKQLRISLLGKARA